MTIVAGVDFGTLSVRVTLVDSQKGPIGTASASYPLHRRREDPNFATQSHADQMTALAAATRDALKSTGVDGSAVAAIALDTTGSSVIPVGEGLNTELPRWTTITSGATIAPLPRPRKSPPKRMNWALRASSGAAAFIHTNGASPSCSTGCATTRRNATALSPLLSIAIWCCHTERNYGCEQAKRSVCAMGHKWMWNPKWDGAAGEVFGRCGPTF